MIKGIKVDLVAVEESDLPQILRELNYIKNGKREREKQEIFLVSLH